MVLTESDSARMLHALSNATSLKMSVANWFETCIVVDGLKRPALERYFEQLMAELNIEFVVVDEGLARMAREAYRRYGKGWHPARLNFGDCFSYALSKRENEPLLFKGNDFSQTDIVPALP